MLDFILKIINHVSCLNFQKTIPQVGVNTPTIKKNQQKPQKATNKIHTLHFTSKQMNSFVTPLFLGLSKSSIGLISHN